MFDNEAVRVAADVIGHDKKPAEYIHWIATNLQKNVSNATVTRTLGKYRDRENKALDSSLLLKANEFFLSCNSNIHYAKSLLDRVRKDIKDYGGFAYA